ncbi:LamG domain-containing protein [Streptomyces sp. NPDC088745]|uniref:LamG domain-containing protein n=1 Tax=Streptomyces sp. NPDC088745 TaxID=3365884 RepID=UPI00381BDA7F
MTGRTRRRATTAVAVALLMTGALPGTASAADENRPPPRPAAADLRTNGLACAPNAAPPYIRSRPVVSAVLRDPDSTARLSGQFEAWWKDSAGKEQRRSFETDVLPGQSHEFQWQLPDDVPPHTPVAWRVRTSDGALWSPWSATSTGAACRFVYDNDVPEPPVITSSDFPQDDAWHDGVGIRTSFRAASPAEDVVSYAYRFSTGAHGSLPARGPGLPVVIPHLAERSGVDTVSVQAVDRAGNHSPSAQYVFRVRSAREPVARWTLGDPVGSPVATATAGPSARAGSGVAFGAAGPSGTRLTTAAVLDGSANGFLTPGATVVKPGTGFAVSAWVRPDRLDRGMTAVSQDSGTAALFSLGLRTAGDSAGWAFTVGGTRVVGGSPAAGKWTHLTGVHDPVAKTARLFVDGREAGVAQQVKPFTTAGDLQLGRERGLLGHQAAWRGGLGDVQLHDRLAFAPEIAENARRKPVSTGNWNMAAALPDGTTPDLAGGQPLALHGGAKIDQADPLNFDGGGYLVLDGTDGHASTVRPAVDTSDSFTVAARVRLAGAADGGPMTVLAQGGTHTDAFKVRYVPESSQWQLVLTEADRPGAREWVAVQRDQRDSVNHVAVVHDRAAGTFQLYLNGSTADGATVSVPSSWQSGTGLHVGRAHAGDGWGEYLKGDVDDVRAFSGALSPSDVSMLSFGFGEPCFCG